MNKEICSLCCPVDLLSSGEQLAGLVLSWAARKLQLPTCWAARHELGLHARARAVCWAGRWGWRSVRRSSPVGEEELLAAVGAGGERGQDWDRCERGMRERGSEGLVGS